MSDDPAAGSDDEIVKLMLSPIGHGCLPGSIKVMASCGHECWLSPDGQKFVTGKRWISACIECLSPEEGITLVPGAMASARAHLANKGLDPGVVLKVAQYWKMKRGE